MAEVGILSAQCTATRCWLRKRRRRFWQAGHKATVYEDPELADWEKYKDKYILVVTSTTGQGDLPDSIVPLFGALKTSLAISQTFATASSPSATALTLTSAAAASSSMRCCRSRAPSASARCC